MRVAGLIYSNGDGTSLFFFATSFYNVSDINPTVDMRSDLI